MKIYISVDLEGICGTTHWNEVTRGKEQYQEFQKQTTAEVVAACDGAFEGGASEIVIKDGHDSACNIIAAELPRKTQLIRGWSRHPYMMMQGLDHSFDAAFMIGYHSLAGSDGNPLSHTMSTKIVKITINDYPASEFLINWYTALFEKVPVVFVSGDRMLCDHAAELQPGIETVAVKEGSGDSTINIHPVSACEKITETACKALSLVRPDYLVELPPEFTATVTYSKTQDAYKASFFPGASLISACTVSFAATDYFDLLRFFLFNI